MYTVGGTVTGLNGSLTLQNNAGDNLTLSTSGNFVFNTRVASGGTYSVTVSAMPSGQTCSVSNGTGTVSDAAITSVQVTCTANSAGSGSGGSGGTNSTYTVGGTVSGLTASGLVLENNGTDDLSLTAGAAAFTFATPLASTSTYQVTIKVQPAGETCSVSNGSGTIAAADIGNVAVNCTPQYTIGGTVTGLKGVTLTLLLQNTGSSASSVVSVLPGQSTFSFGPGLPNGTGYDVTVTQQPSGQSCSVSNGTGTLSGYNVSSLSISCTTVSQWAWISGDDSSLSAVYGTLGQTASANTPGARSGSATSTDGAGNLWLFGGGNSDLNLTSDLWVYSFGTGEWTWMEGNSAPNTAGVYGTQGTPASGNVPGARYGAVSWTDSAGNLWLFGGQGYDSAGTQGYLNDLWKYNYSSGQWTWVSGSNVTNESGVYGSAGVPSPNAHPGGRLSAAGWIDTNNSLWLLGGEGIDANNTLASLNDLWKFDARAGQWIWIGGSQTGNAAGAYGTRGVPDTANSPGARQAAVTWMDTAGQLWLFGGLGFDAAGTDDALNDLWRYSPTSGLWTWMGGSSTVDARGAYGVQGVAAATNVPGARYRSTPWVDPSGTFWLLGGEGYDSTNNISNIQNDFWKYDPASGNWTWIAGADSDGGGDPGLYHVRGLPAADNSPGARIGAMSWSDLSGLSLYGGAAASPEKPGSSSYTIAQDGGNDLWHFGPPIFYNGTGSMTGTFTDQNGCQYSANAEILNANVTMSTESAGAVTINYTVPAWTKLASDAATCPQYLPSSGSFSVPVSVNGSAVQSLQGVFGTVSATLSDGVFSGTVGFQETGAQGSGTFSWTERGTFSTSATPVTVPNLIGTSQVAAATAINGAELWIGTVTYQNSTTVPAGEIISQTPAAGSTAATGSRVNLVLSSGPTIPAPTVTLTADQTSIASGGVVTLQWSASSAASCVASGGWSGPQALSGSFTSGTLSQNTTFTLSCSGPGGSTVGSQLITVSQAAAIVLSSTTGTIALGSALSDGDTTVDFTQDPSLMGQTATVQHISAQLVTDDADELAPIGVDFSQTATLRIALPAAPTTDLVHVSINISALSAIPAGSFPALYAWSDAPAGDGTSGFVPLPTTYTPTTEIVEADIPRYEFTSGSSLGDSTLPYVAILRIGIAPTSSSAFPAPSLAASAGGAKKLTLRAQATASAASVQCPLADIGCVETSMFNPNRLYRGSTEHHNGIDLRAAAPTNVYSIPGGQVLTGLFPVINDKKQIIPGKFVQESKSSAWYTANKSSLTDGGQLAGVAIWVKASLSGEPVTFKYFHLSDAAGYLVNQDPATNSANGGLIPGSVVEPDGLIGTTGHSGSAETGGPHLHWEMWTNSVPVCTGTSCSRFIQGPVDPFPYMVKNFSIAAPNSPPLTLAMAPFTFPVTATDTNNVSISSDVGNAAEITQLWQPGDPTRKVCFYDSASELTYTFNPTNPANSGPVGPPLLPTGNYQCAPWTTQFGATANAGGVASTTVTAQFTLDPGSPISASQVLSSLSATVAIGASSFAGIVQGTLPLQGFTFSCSPGPTCTVNDVTFAVSIAQDGGVSTSPVNQNGNWFLTNCAVCSPLNPLMGSYDWTLSSGTLTTCTADSGPPCQSGSAILQLRYSENTTSLDGVDYCNFTIILSPGSSGITPTAKQGGLCNYAAAGLQATLPSDTGPPAVTFTAASQ